jgi:hypothetical protein
MFDTQLQSEQTSRHDMSFNDANLRDRVLSVYFDNTRYLKTADIQVDRTGTKEQILSKGEFSIPESCYIQSTGHFNSVEFNICYNQIMYDAIAHAAKYDLVDLFSGWGVDGFFSRQLPDILITRFQSRFSKPINSVRFSGEFAVRSARLHRTAKPFLFLKTDCRFFDDSNGEATGEVDLAIMNP